MSVRILSPEEMALRTLPHNLEAEKSLLGGLLINNAAYVTVAPHVRPVDFFRRAHGSIFAAMGRLLDELHRDADLVTLSDELRRAGELEECGGPAYIAALTEGVPRSANVASYAKIVHEMAVLRRIIRVGGEMQALAYEAEEPSQAIINTADKAIMELQRGGQIGRMADLRETHAALYEDLEWREKHRGQLVGVETGFESINHLTLGWQSGELIVLAARPSIGKTAFTLHTAMAAAKAGKKVAFFSLEMRRRQLEYRMLSSLSGIALTRLQSGYLGEADYDRLAPAMAILSKAPILIDDRAGQGAADIRASCRRVKAEQGLDLVVIDYVQLIPGSLERRGANRNDEVTDISRRIKALSDEVNAPVLLLSQLNRASEVRADPRPKLSDLRESGALEQDADKVVFLHRKHHLESGVTNVIFEKDRNGPGGVVNVTFNRDNQTFLDGGEEPAPSPDPEPARSAPSYWERRLRRR